MKKRATKRNQGIGYYFLGLVFNLFETALIGAGIMAIVYFLTRWDVIDYTISSSPMELFICFIAGSLILGGINLKMQKKMITSFKKQIHNTYSSVKEKWYNKGFQEGFHEGLKKGEAELLKNSPSYISTLKRIQ